MVALLLWLYRRHQKRISESRRVPGLVRETPAAAPEAQRPRRRAAQPCGYVFLITPVPLPAAGLVVAYEKP